MPRLSLLFLAAVLSSGCTSIGGESFGWALTGADPSHVGTGGVAIRWRQRITPPYEGAYRPVERAIATVDPPRDRVYVGSTSGMLYAMNSGGRRIYRYDAGGAVESKPLLDSEENVLYFGTEQGDLHALRAGRGELLWREDAGGPIRQTPLAYRDAIYTVTDTDVVTAFAKESGEVLWSYERDAPEGFSITSRAGLVRHLNMIVTGYTDGAVVALNASDGSVVWERDTSVEIDDLAPGRPEFVDVDTTPVFFEDSFYVASFTGGLFRLEAASGTIEYRDETRKGIIGMSRVRDLLVLASADDGIVCITLPDHREVWRHELTRGAPSVPVVESGFVFVGESVGSFLVLSLDTGTERSRFDAGHGFSAPPAVSHGRGFVVSNGGSLFAFGL
ncbi:MAG: PQQ-binding-like beta-propeller repeat protein [Myxococcota bacterium]